MEPLNLHNDESSDNAPKDNAPSDNAPSEYYTNAEVIALAMARAKALRAQVDAVTSSEVPYTWATRVQTEDPIYIVVDGLTGAGKSTLIESMLVPELKDAGFTVVFVRELAEGYGELLRDYYADPQRWAFTFQAKVIRDHVDNFSQLYAEHAEHGHKVAFISERDEHAHAIFARVHHTLGNMTTREYEIYIDLWQTLVTSLPIRADITIYLDVGVEESLRRVHERARDGEVVNEHYQAILAEESRPRVGPNLIITPDFTDEDLSELFHLIDIVYSERSLA